MIGPGSSRKLTIDRKGAAARQGPDRIEACLRGDQTAWNELVDRYGRLVYSIARRYRLDDADCDDVFQGVFLILYRRLETLQDHRRLSAWLITTTHRECWRIGKRSGNNPDLDQIIEDVSTPSVEQIETWEQQHLVRLGLEQLGGRCEELLRALFLEGSEGDYRTIADRFGMQVGSIGPTRARCFQKLEKILLDLGLEAPPDAARAPEP